MEASQRAAVQGPTFIRLLARLGDADVPPPRQSLSDRLSQWIDWAHAVALSTALDARPSLPDELGQDDGTGECARVRAVLVEAIVGDRAFGPLDETPDQAFFRQRCVFMQQLMETEAGRLRDRLRQQLAARTAGLGRLAATDAVMERALGRQERALLANVPVLLGERFERLRQAAQDIDASDNWLDTFRNEMRSVLLAELDLRLQPAQGLSAALRNETTE